MTATVHIPEGPAETGTNANVPQWTDEVTEETGSMQVTSTFPTFACMDI